MKTPEQIAEQVFDDLERDVYIDEDGRDKALITRAVLAAIEADRAQRAEKMSAQRLVDELLHAAKGVAYWEDHGTHGDGRLEQAKEDLKSKRRDVIREINRLRGGYAS